MGRVVVILSIVCGVWLGYGWLSGPPAAPSSAGSALVESSLVGGNGLENLGLENLGDAPMTAAATSVPDASETRSETVASRTPPDGAAAPAASGEDREDPPAVPVSTAAPLSATQSPTEAALRRQVGEILQGLSGDREHRVRAADGAFDLITRSRGRLRAQLATAVRDAAGRSASLPDKVALLGNRNRFLHTAEGRALAGEIIEAASECDDAQVAVDVLTELLTAAMRGQITKQDDDAREVVDRAYQALQAPLRKTVLNPAHHARARSHKLKKGETLSHVVNEARRNGIKVDPGTLALVNRISDPRRIHAGQMIKIPIDELHTVVEKRSFLMGVYLGEALVRLYWIGHGRDDRTPETTFIVQEKLTNPDWYAPNGKVIPAGHPENELGKYFVKFKHESYSGFGAHEALDPNSVHEQASAGCIRMALPDISDFFALVPRGSKIEVRATR